MAIAAGQRMYSGYPITNIDLHCPWYDIQAHLQITWAQNPLLQNLRDGT